MVDVDSACTLEFGKFISKKLFIFYFIMCGIVLVTLISVLLYLITDELRNAYLHDIVGVAVLMIVTLLILGCLVVLLCIKKQNVKTVKCWLGTQDLMKIKTVPYLVAERGLGPYKVISIGITFYDNDKQVEMVSRKYCKAYREYVDKCTDAYYSPSFNQIVFI